MHLVVDAQALQTQMSRRRGVGRYARNFLHALAMRRPQWRIEAVINTRLPPPDPGALGSGVAVTAFEPLLPAAPSTVDVNERYFGDWLSARRPDAIVEMNFFEEEALVPFFAQPRPPLAGVLYDLIPLLFHEHYLRDPRRRAWYARRLQQFAQVDLALAISEATRRDALHAMRWTGSRAVTILGAADLVAAPAPPSSTDRAATLKDLGIDRPFILCVGGGDARKNLDGTLAAFAALPPETRATHLLVVVGALAPSEVSALDRRAEALGIQRDLRLTNYVDDAVLRMLYGACRLSVFVPHYEGLGLPVLEALSSGAPVVASSGSGIPEFAGPASWLADPASPRDVAAAIMNALSEARDARLDERRRFAAGFQWPATADRAAEAIDGLRRRPVRPSPSRPRVAWVSPLPPTRSGIADYSAEILTRLDHEFEIEVVISPEATLDADLARRFTMLRADEAGPRHADHPFDLFVHHLGNSELHLYMLDLMRRLPGLTVLHDVQLGGLALHAADVGGWFGGLAPDLELEGAAALAGDVRRGVADHDRIARETALNRRFVDSSEGVIVHSAWSWSRVRSQTTVPVFRIPMGVPHARSGSPAAARAHLGLPPDAFIVATLGEVTPAKRVDRLIRSAGALPERIRARMQILIVGETPAACAADLRAAAAAEGIADRVTVLGRVPLAELAEYGRGADACVQLRYPTRGESSAALLRALAAGSACIVSEGGSFAELPADVALTVRTPEFEESDLSAALIRLHDDPALALRLRERAARFALERHDLDGAARRYAAVMRLTIDRRRRFDGEWRDAASMAMATALRDAAVDGERFERWVQVREAARASR